MGNQDDIEQKFMDFRKKQTLFIAVSFIVNAAVVMLLCLYYNFKQRALTGALYLYDKTAAENYLDVLSKMKITQAVGRYVNEGNAAIEKIGYGSKGYSYIFLLSGEIWIYIIALLILSVIFICGMVSIRSMTAHSVIADALAVKERNVILENRLKQENEYNKKQQRKMQDFIENIAHQIKTPLTALSLSLDMMEEQLNARKTDVQLNSYISDAQSEVVSGKALTDTGLSSNEKLISNLGECFRQTYRIRDFITRLLKLSRMESGKIVLTEDDINVNEFINEVISEVPVVNNCNITSYCDDEDYFINADEEWLLEAFINIVQNCSEEAENVDINAVCNADKCIITIKDDGKGIAKDKLDNIFNRFESGKSYNSLHTGIGLNLSKLIIEAHHGSVSVNNNEDGRGVSFRIIIPKYNMKRKAK